jgi:uncharacterized repeat protein (TIGR03803 family)
MDRRLWQVAKPVCAILATGVAAAIALQAQTFTTLYSFGGADGALPWAALVQGTNGDLYGTTVQGGAAFEGTVFKVTTSGALTTLYTFCSQSGCPDGGDPYNDALIQATNGDFYGTTGLYGGNGQGGTVFRMAPDGKLATIYSFCSQSGCTDGDGPAAGLVQAASGYLYGTTNEGGLNGEGAVFKITPGGTLTTLYSFCAQSDCTDGAFPYSVLTQATNGYLYGTTENGGANASGTVFKITPSGTLTTVYSFCSEGNPEPQAVCAEDGVLTSGLVEGPNGELWGTAQNLGTGTYGAIFEITLSGTLSELYSFCGPSACTGGIAPSAGLVRATDGNFYGTTFGGGANAHGTIFEITPAGTLTTLYSFCSQAGCPDGSSPAAALVQDTNGDLYGTTLYGGAHNVGAVFSLSVGLGPFVKTLPISGKTGAAVEILGTALTGTTSVTFNGTEAAFTVVSPTEITTTVPAGATSGKVQVITPGGTLSSNVAFRVS